MGIHIDLSSMGGCVLLVGGLKRSDEVKIFAELLPSEAVHSS
jgi:hypothetical protein